MSRLIDADAFDATMYEAWMNCEITNEEWFHFREMIKDEPTIEPQRMRGKWIPQGWNDTYCKCSCCDAVYVTAEIPYSFCPNCGAWMGGQE